MVVKVTLFVQPKKELGMKALYQMRYELILHNQLEATLNSPHCNSVRRNEIRNWPPFCPEIQKTAIASLMPLLPTRSTSSCS
jgi:hypothetical protein